MILNCTICYGLVQGFSTHYISADDSYYSYVDLGNISNTGNVDDVINTNFQIPNFNDSFYDFDSGIEDLSNSNGITGDYEIKDGVIFVKEGGTLELGINTEAEKVVLNNAKSIKLSINSSIDTLEGTVEEANFGYNSTVNNLDLKVDNLTASIGSELKSGNIYVYEKFEGMSNFSFGGKMTLDNAKSIKLSINSLIDTLEGTVEEANFGNNSTVNTLYLKVDNLITSINAKLKSGNIYVYENFDGGINSSFEGKMTVYGETSISINSDIDGRYCSLGKVSLGINAGIRTYSMDGLLGNVDPILDVSIKDDDAKFSEVKKITKKFDGEFESSMKKISEYNYKIADLNKKISKATGEDKDSLESELVAVKSQKEKLKEETISFINETFSFLKEYIDTDERNLNLFCKKIKNMYIYAVKYENSGSVYNICNNSEISSSMNSTYERNGKLYINGKEFLRKVILPVSQIESIDKMLDKVPDEKLAKIDSKVDALMKKISSKKKITKSDEKNLNILMDVKEIIRNEMLYD